jgi:hypothetical protein
VFVLDATTLGALFDAYPPVFDLWELADRGELTLAVPALAIVTVKRGHVVRRADWDAVLWPTRVEVLPLTETVAVEIGEWTGELHARHALWEARQMGWPILTRDAGLYAAGADLREI